MIAKASLPAPLRERFEKAMDESGIRPEERARFWPLFTRFHRGERGEIKWEEIQKLRIGDPGLVAYEAAASSLKETKPLDLSGLAVIKLNGGLGTGMGLEGPKSLLKVTRDETFLTIALGQNRAASRQSGDQVPLVLMNSFNTEGPTQAALAQLGDPGVPVRHMRQGQFLRIQVSEAGKAFAPDEVRPLPAELGDDRLNPPGHGEVYSVLKDSGMLDALLKSGVRYAFIANGDNLGAVPDPMILAYMRENRIPFLLEVTKRTANDVKGGTVSRKRDTPSLKLLELANVPEEHKGDFQDIDQFPVFNTNNMWVDLEALRAQLEKGPLEMDLIANPKSVGTAQVIQLEQAMGSAISSFPGAVAMVVPRSRFRPVKSCAELFLLRSSLFTYADGVFQARGGSEAKLPTVRLNDAFYKKIGDFEARFPEIPDITKLQSLSIEGNVYFDKGVVLEGDVTIVAGPNKVVIPAGTHLKSGKHQF